MRFTSTPNFGSLRLPLIVIGMNVLPSLLKIGSNTLSTIDFQPPTVCETFASIIT